MEADYGIDWDGPYGFDDLRGASEQVEVPRVQLQRRLTEEDTARLPDPNVPFLDALDIYTATLQQLIQWQCTPALLHDWIKSDTKLPEAQNLLFYYYFFKQTFVNKKYCTP